MQKYEYNVTIEHRDDVWYYVIAQEFDECVEFLGWGISDSAAEASEAVSTYIREQFEGVSHV